MAWEMGHFQKTEEPIFWLRRRTNQKAEPGEAVANIDLAVQHISKANRELSSMERTQCLEVQ